MEFRYNLKHLRESNGLTQTELANKIGIAQSMVAQYERGSKVPSIMVADIIAGIFGVTCDELIHGLKETQ